jgi:hypothetical protein
MKWSLPSQACCSLKVETIDFLNSYISWVLANIMIWVFPLFLEMWQKLRIQISYHDMADTLGRLFCTYNTHCWKLMKSVVSHGSSSLLFMSEGEEHLTLCDWLSEGYNCTHCHVTFKLVLCRLLCNFMDVWCWSNAGLNIREWLALELGSHSNICTNISTLHYWFRSPGKAESNCTWKLNPAARTHVSLYFTFQVFSG